MLRSSTAAVLMGVGLLAACSPTFNWRQIRAAPTALNLHSAAPQESPFE